MWATGWLDKSCLEGDTEFGTTPAGQRELNFAGAVQKRQSGDKNKKKSLQCRRLTGALGLSRHFSMVVWSTQVVGLLGGSGGSAYLRQQRKAALLARTLAARLTAWLAACFPCWLTASGDVKGRRRETEKQPKKSIASSPAPSNVFNWPELGTVRNEPIRLLNCLAD